VTNGQYEKINGVMVDLFTASAVVTVFDAFEVSRLPVTRMASIAFQLVK
jgi:hypothetical protein